jgi:hypothetical protein
LAVKIFKIIALLFARQLADEEKRLVIPPERAEPNLVRTNFRISEQKLYLDFKNPFKILVSAMPDRREGIAQCVQSSKTQYLRWYLDKVLTYFKENPLY